MAGDADLVKAGIDAALAPVKDFANRLFGPAVDELGGILADPIRMLRFKRSVRLLEKVKQICDETGFEPKAVPLKTLLPIMENASLEDDEDLHDRWANLLANAANPHHPDDVLPSFPDILRQLIGRHAALMDAVFGAASERAQTIPESALTAASVSSIRFADRYHLLAIARSIPSPLGHQYAEFDDDQWSLLVDDLVRLRLLAIGVHAEPSISVAPDKAFGSDDILTQEYYYLSALGYSFVTACKKPKPQL